MAVLHNMNGTNAPAAVILMRVLIGGTFLSAGIQKFLYPTSLTLGVSLESASLIRESPDHL